ncbi:hypothetical protein ACFYXF_03680 [Streptomyces sp. NPDC002680]|uniref:hypothetical protein n=1 Tax=Streptomyces sp. NPDC002680 TaxID=3364659 RepID=UPI00369D4DBE
MLVPALERLHRLAGEVSVPFGSACLWEEDVLWAPHGRGNLVTGHRRELAAFREGAADLNSSDVYSLFGCPGRHHVMAVAYPPPGRQLAVLAYIPNDDEIVELGIHGDRLLIIERPHDLPEASMPALT